MSNNPIQEKMISSTDDELIDIVEKNFSDYTEEAISYALGEISRRGIDKTKRLFWYVKNEIDEFGPMSREELIKFIKLIEKEPNGKDIYVRREKFDNWVKASSIENLLILPSLPSEKPSVINVNSTSSSVIDTPDTNIIKKFIKKLPGFRTGIWWKMLIAIIGYPFLLFLTFNFKGITMGDKFVCLLGNLILIWVPFILITNVENIRDRLPLFNKKQSGLTVVGIIVTIILMAISLGILDNMKSSQLKEALKVDNEQWKFEQERKSKENIEAKEKAKLEQSSQNYSKGIEAFNSKDYSTSESFLKQVISSDPNYSDAQSKLKEINNLIATDYLNSAKIKLTNNDFNGAREDTRKALSYNSGLVEANNLLLQIDTKERVYQEEMAKREIDEYKSSCQKYEYRVLNKNPDSLAGKRVKLYGNIMQIQESGNNTFMLLQVTNIGYGIWDDNVAVFYPSKADIYENDKITIWGEIDGAYNYESVAGWNLTIPKVTAKYLQK